VHKDDTGWRRLTGSLELQIIFHKRATKYKSLLRKMTHKDKGSYESSPPCIVWPGALDIMSKTILSGASLCTTTHQTILCTYSMSTYVRTRQNATHARSFTCTETHTHSHTHTHTHSYEVSYHTCTNAYKTRSDAKHAYYMSHV